MIILDLKQVEELLNIHEERIKKIETLIASNNSTFHVPKEKSIKEFILEKNPKGTYQLGTVIAYYIENYVKISTFTIEDLEQGFKDAKEPLPQNMSDLMYKNTKKGFFMESKELKNGLKSYLLTNTGEKLVENNFTKIKTK